MPRRISLLASAIAMATAGSPAFAQSEPMELGEIVVTAAGFEQNISDAPASISTISGDELEKKSYSSIVDAVNNIPGVFVTGGGASQDISIRGMDSSYTLYLIDGRPISDGRSVNTNGTDGGKQIGLPPVSMIERVEVIRGPMSSLYGSSAMGGVINIITKKPTDEFSGSITTEYNHSLNDINNDGQQVSFSTSAPIIKGLLGAQVHGSWLGLEEADYIGGDDNAESTPETDTRQGGVELYLTPDEENEFTLGYTSSTKEYTHRPGASIPLMGGRGGNTPNEVSTTRYDKDVYTVGHKGNYGNLMTDTYLQHDVSERIQEDEKKEDLTTFNTQATYFWGEHVLTMGGQYKEEELVDESNGLLSANVPGAVRSVDRWLASLYAEMEWRLTDKLNLTTGVRYDDDELFGGHLSPRVYANYHATPQWTLKGGISTGYRQPGLSDATEGFGRGTGGGDWRNIPNRNNPRALIIGNEDLDPETSTNYEFGFVYQNPARTLNTSAMLFFTQFDDKIAEDRLCETANPDRYDPSTWDCSYQGVTYQFVGTRSNISEAEMQGVELTMDYDITRDVRLSSSYTYTESEQKTGEFAGEPLNRVPKHMANVSVDWQATTDLSLWAQGNYRGKTSDYLSRTSMGDGTPDYGFVDVGLVYNLSSSARMKAGIYNLANDEVTNDDYEVVLDGRMLNVGLTVDF
ncbi:TonB-dependent receptor domain-containing protein [Marinobacter oulmenensis]|uniref:Outer membrane receptor for ferrienterochelin and colicins n=1 Tax=Marinobacter oulmenensis TaxID=643747 RepID=A0A840UGQ3_9GAMM|nr:TonB-dependent receptor [Marinobacter oulmenensis]MBB5319957.1 outer membrane receptor for ferrienterochelin and colicins [Marinobacter oulmenensis]